MKSNEIDTSESRLILYIYDILCRDSTQGKDHQLLVIKFAFLAEALPFQSIVPNSAPESQPIIDKKEVVLCFSNFDTMGERQDAEVVPLKSIVTAKDCSTKLTYVTSLPKGLLESHVFYIALSICR